LRWSLGYCHEGTELDSLSTMSTNDPDVVNGIRASMLEWIVTLVTVYCCPIGDPVQHIVLLLLQLRNYYYSLYLQVDHPFPRLRYSLGP